MNKSSFAVLAALCLNACSALGGREPDEGAEIDPLLSAQTMAYETVAESFLTPLTPDDNIDSPASWTAPDGSVWLIATAKATDKLVVYDGDTGVTRSAIGGHGAKPGEFRRPNGIFVADDLVFVVERDNRRVQVLALPSLQPLGHFGEAQLQAPYGLWVKKADQGYEVLVSDAYMDGEAVPPPAQLDRRFKRYHVRTAGGFRAEHLGDFGDTDADGAIRIPESIWGDAGNGALLLSEEDQLAGTQLKVYGPDYRYAGKTIGQGLFKAQAEGIALWQCPDGSGYWIATDQFKDRSLFHVFDRRDFSHKGAFAGNTTANTDGVWLNQGATKQFPDGVFYAVHDDQGVAAFDWRAIAAALDLRVRCE
jgi:3-phytase